MRASVLVLGPLLARCGARARVAARRLRDRRAPDRPAPQGPGGDGRRRSTLEHGYVKAQRATAARRRHRASTCVTVTGTENLMMAAALAEGTHGARERRARAGGRGARRAASTRWARRSRAPAPTASRSRASTQLHGATHAIIPDRIEAGTFLAAAAIDRRRRRCSQAASPSTSSAVHRQAARGRRRGRRRRRRHPRARRTARLRAVDVTHRAATRASPPTCRRSSWR